MKARILAVMLVLFSFTPSLFCTGKGKTEIHPVMKLELKRLDELWNVLDQVAAKVWPGWAGYTDVPFLFDYENNVRMLVGHPDPPPEFELVEGVEVRGKKVYLDRQNEVPVELVWPTSGGGGPIPFGKNRKEKVKTLWIRLMCNRNADKENPDNYSENQILIYVHELFHVYQGIFYTVPLSGNFFYDADTNYAVYSEIEGEALLGAFQEKNDKAAREYMKDFVEARKLKYRSMAQLEQIQEKEEDFMEGTARYSEYATLLEITKGYKPKLTEKDLPFFFGFKNLDYYFSKRLKELEESKGNTFHTRYKCYEYGCFQALLLRRFVKGWQKTIPQEFHFQYDVIVDFLNMDKEEEKQVAQRLNEKYDYKSLYAKYDPLIRARDHAFSDYDEQKGKVYVVDFKQTGESFIPRDKSESYTMFSGGYRIVYPQGFKEIVIKEVSLEGKGKPMLKRLYSLSYVDTQNAGYKVDCSRKEGDVYYDAVVSTEGFTLKAPEVKIKEKENKVRIIILSKVAR